MGYFNRPLMTGIYRVSLNFSPESYALVKDNFNPNLKGGKPAEVNQLQFKVKFLSLF